MDSCLILLCLFVFVQGDAADVHLRCNETADVQAGQSLTIHCEINSSAHYNHPCEAKRIDCKCSGQPFESCHFKKKKKIQHISVEFSNVTVTGTYTINLLTRCGIEVNGSIKINVSNVSNVTDVSPPPSLGTYTDPQGETKGYIAMVCGALALVAIIAVVILGIRKHRRDRSTPAESQGEYQRAPQTC